MVATCNALGSRMDRTCGLVGVLCTTPAPPIGALAVSPTDGDRRAYVGQVVAGATPRLGSGAAPKVVVPGVVCSPSGRFAATGVWSSISTTTYKGPTPDFAIGPNAAAALRRSVPGHLLLTSIGVVPLSNDAIG